MKRPIMLSLVLAVTLLLSSVFTIVHAQAPANDDKPTFYHLVPGTGTYVNGWPRFTVHYPKE